MKATGIVRRIDDLGRVVIPKEIRRTLRIREGDPLEIFTEQEGEVVLKKYSPMGELSDFADMYAKSLSETTGGLVCITDKDRVIAARGNKHKEYDGKQITKALEEFIENRENGVFSAKEKGYISIIEDDMAKMGKAIATIITQGDAIGSVVLYGKDEEKKMGDLEKKLVMTAAAFLGSQMEQ